MIVLHAHHTDITSACGIVLCAYADFLHVLSQALFEVLVSLRIMGLCLPMYFPCSLPS